MLRGKGEVNVYRKREMNSNKIMQMKEKNSKKRYNNAKKKRKRAEERKEKNLEVNLVWPFRKSK